MNDNIPEHAGGKRENIAPGKCYDIEAFKSYY
jgi:hypothetical protein